MLEPGETQLPHVTLSSPSTGERSTYLKLRDRASYEFALVSVAVAITLANGAIASARFALRWHRHATLAGEAEAERALVGQVPKATKRFAPPPKSDSRGARPQSQNGFKIELARRCIVHAFKQITTMNCQR